MSAIAIVGIITVFICCILAAFLLVVPSSEKSFSNKFLAAFLFFTAVDISGWFILYCISPESFFEALRRICSFLQMPLFLGFVLTSCYSKIDLKIKDLIHLLPFLLAVLLLFPGSQLSGFEANTSNYYITSEEFYFVRWGLNIQHYLYMAMVFYSLFKCRAIFLQNYADERSKTLSWLFQFATISLAASSIAAIKSFYVELNISQEWFPVLQLIVGSIALAIMIWIAFKALLQPELFRGIDKNLKRVAKLAGNEDAMASKDKISKELSSLREYMEKEEPYLNSALSLRELADQMKLPFRELSRLINEQLDIHFFDFINQYRVKKAQQLLVSPESPNITYIMYEVGFNSKSSFNTAFKKHSGVTPSEYKRRKKAF